jgi:hypothetical protein
MISEVSVVVTWPHCLWTCDEAEHHGGNMWRRKLLTSWHWKAKREEGAIIPVSTPRAHPQWSHFLLPLKNFTTSLPIAPQIEMHTVNTRAFREYSKSKLQLPTSKENGCTDTSNSAKTSLLAQRKKPPALPRALFFGWIFTLGSGFSQDKLVSSL